jgi:3-hydroxybutyryl-CoA dehydratase
MGMETQPEKKPLGVIEVEITQAGIDAYAEVAGDFNPIHVDPEYAAQTPFGGTVAHGFYVLSFGSVLLGRLFGRRWFEGGAMDVRFKRPARPGDRMRVWAYEKGKTAQEGGPALEVGIVWENQNGETLLEGTACVSE